MVERIFTEVPLKVRREYAYLADAPHRDGGGLRQGSAFLGAANDAVKAAGVPEKRGINRCGVFKKLTTTFSF